MASVAMIGSDGAGKTTIARMLENASGLRCKYLYMGISVEASNFALWTSRVAERLKRWRSAGRGVAPGLGAGRGARSRKRGRLWAAARLVNRVADEWYRQLISWVYEVRGFLVIYDRYFVFDYAEEIEAGEQSLSRRFHRWLLARVYPRPDLVIYLDAPAAVLYARKGESTVEELERRRQIFLQLGRREKNLVCVDATKPLEDVYKDVLRIVTSLRAARGWRRRLRDQVHSDRRRTPRATAQGNGKWRADRRNRPNDNGLVHFA